MKEIFVSSDIEETNEEGDKYVDRVETNIAYNDDGT